MYEAEGVAQSSQSELAAGGVQPNNRAHPSTLQPADIPPQHSHALPSWEQPHSHPPRRCARSRARAARRLNHP
ncbi:hypothetical protein PGTUg99_027288 [Puccinia graminis f. sp. tritici]|uniref:Uncharacterized protein n=1 Tax=Puccinia graminis f. sp. tritici TaxID=56615 RepID=A0A5B0MXI3_PUCGR|nr:hypothetical protein PGTUg99_027288 [Puccinia graminis f. sp. tritici]